MTYGNQKDIWYQEYNGEKVVVFNDFEGQGGLGHHLRLTDAYMNRVGYKGGATALPCAVVIYTMNDPWESCFPGMSDRQRQAMERRITTHLRMWNEHPKYGQPVLLRGLLRQFAAKGTRHVLDSVTIKGEEVRVLIEEVEGEYLKGLQHCGVKKDAYGVRLAGGPVGPEGTDHVVHLHGER